MENKSSKTSYGQCRCCLAKGHHKNMMKEYFFNGIREVYFDIFMDCFNLFLSTDTQITTLICNSCIQRLRDATSFRMMVVSTERQLLEAVNGNDDKGTVFVNVLIEDNTLEIPADNVKNEKPIQVKEELSDIEVDIYDSDYVPSDTASEGDVSLEVEHSKSDLVKGEAALLARFKHMPPKLPNRRTLPDICPVFCSHLDKLRDTTIYARNITKMLDDHNRRKTTISSRNLYITEKSAHVLNASTLLLNSNVTPFRSKSRTGFPCFYCRNIFDNFAKLRDHTAEHKKSDIIKILRTYGPECLVVYVDIRDLKCTLCEKDLQNLNELKTHLVNVHNKKMHPEFTDRVIPYRMPDSGACECQICGFNFETFGAIERHMNVHFRNYICKDCGTGFVTRYRLKVHIKSMHSIENIPCEICGKIFATQQKHKNHVNAVHKLVKRFKCAKCPERFAEYFRRQKHMVQFHGVAPLHYTCNVCDKSFDRRYTLSRHMKRDHLEERDFQCEMCSYKCFTKNELTVHMVKHNGERIFECSVCKKSYARKKTLKEHLRIHNNDRRFACAVCGQAFVQKCSLKGHLKTHHLEFSLH